MAPPRPLNLLILNPLPMDMSIRGVRYPVRWHNQQQCHGSYLFNGSWFPTALASGVWHPAVYNESNRLGIWLYGSWVPVFKCFDGVLRPKTQQFWLQSLTQVISEKVQDPHGTVAPLTSQQAASARISLSIRTKNQKQFNRKSQNLQKASSQAALVDINAKSKATRCEQKPRLQKELKTLKRSADQKTKEPGKGGKKWSGKKWHSQKVLRKDKRSFSSGIALSEHVGNTCSRSQSCYHSCRGSLSSSYKSCKSVLSITVEQRYKPSYKY